MLAAVALGMMLAVSEVTASPSPPIQTALLSVGFAQVKLSDVKDTPEYTERLSDPSGFLAVSGDFRGDGLRDQAGILRNVRRGVAYVIVSSIRTEADTYVVKQMPLAEADDVGLRLADPLNGKGYGLTVFSLTTPKAETFDLVNDDFVRRAAH